ncbi:hypothetical protein GOP47_0001409 [Adiantum capillus-veneris]|uniref:Uncharacterized protein n=1 Tax=Adiantum capillus-veneris TaxID=13818 RepID=A0A9D4V9G4_ADICA|nr:hypothetical protein GOP47_0001409 [Adiantum capillus-veneris]
MTSGCTIFVYAVATCLEKASFSVNVSKLKKGVLFLVALRQYGPPREAHPRQLSYLHNQPATSRAFSHMIP